MSQIISNKEAIASVRNNRIVMADADSFEMPGSEISFEGEGNILFIDKNVTLKNSKIRFNADNAVVYLSETEYPYLLDIMVNNNCICWLGRDGYYNGILHIICSEGKSVFIGNAPLMSFNIWIRTADTHLVYSIDTKERINPSKSIFIGDHVWIGQGAFILKGSRIHSGSILGAGSVLTGKKVSSNTTFAGNPARQIAEGIFWDPACVHKWTEADTENMSHYNQKVHWVYHTDKKTLSFDDIERELAELSTADEKLGYLKALSQNADRNRFACGKTYGKKKRKLWTRILRSR